MTRYHAGRIPLKLAPFLAPAVLFVLACIQVWTAATTELSPWKGGGFGMFSTVEAPSSRIIRVSIVTGDIRVPVQVPDPYRRLAAQIRTMPTQVDVEQLAVTLAAQSWTTYKVMPSQEQYYRLRLKYFPGSRPAVESSASIQVRYAAALNELFDHMQWVRMVRAGEKAAELFDFEAVEVECLQMQFDRAKGRLRLETLAKARKERHGSNGH